MSQAKRAGETLSAPYVVEYTYTRSTGPVIERFFNGLAEGRIEGIVGADGRVIVPPQEYDPNTSEELDEWVEVADTGVVTTWGWTNEPLPGQPLQKPFAWALIKLDGADVPMLHAVDAGDESAMSTGMRVRVRWAAEPVADISAIECFVPDDGGAK
jgi:uncharacterized OB-fold protein